MTIIDINEFQPALVLARPMQTRLEEIWKNAAHNSPRLHDQQDRLTGIVTKIKSDIPAGTHVHDDIEMRRWANNHARDFQDENSLLSAMARRRQTLGQHVDKVLRTSTAKWKPRFTGSPDALASSTADFLRAVRDGAGHQMLIRLATNSLLFADTYGARNQTLSEAIQAPTATGPTLLFEQRSVYKAVAAILRAPSTQPGSELASYVNSLLYLGADLPNWMTEACTKGTVSHEELPLSSFDMSFRGGLNRYDSFYQAVDQSPGPDDEMPTDTALTEHQDWTAAAGLQQQERRVGKKAIPYLLDENNDGSDPVISCVRARRLKLDDYNRQSEIMIARQIAVQELTLRQRPHLNRIGQMPFGLG